MKIPGLTAFKNKLVASHKHTLQLLESHVACRAAALSACSFGRRFAATEFQNSAALLQHQR